MLSTSPLTFWTDSENLITLECHHKFWQLSPTENVEKLEPGIFSALKELKMNFKKLNSDIGNDAMKIM